MDTVLQYLILAKNSASQVFDGVRKGVEGMGDAAKKAKTDWAELSAGMTDVMSSIDAVNAGIKTAKMVINETVGATVEYAKQVRDLSRTIGASAEETSMLIQAADDMTISYETLTAGMQNAIRRGVSPSIDGIAALADEYNSIQDPIQRTKFLMDTFGRAGADLGPLMEQGAAGIRSMGEEALKAGLVMDEKAIQAARNYEIQMDNMSDKVDAAKYKIGNGLIPVIADTIDLNIRAADVIEEHNLAWTRGIPVLTAIVGIYGFINAALDQTADKAKDAAKEIETASKQAASMPGYSGTVPIVGHGTSYKAGQGPAYPRSDSNPSGYVMDYQTGQKSYPGRASGGPMFAGIPRMVGEERPEVFTPGKSGWIDTDMPASGGGGLQVYVNLSSVVGIQDQAEAERILFPVIENAYRRLKRNGQ